MGITTIKEKHSKAHEIPGKAATFHITWEKSISQCMHSYKAGLLACKVEGEEASQPKGHHQWDSWYFIIVAAGGKEGLYYVMIWRG